MALTIFNLPSLAMSPRVIAVTQTTMLSPAMTRCLSRQTAWQLLSRASVTKLV